MPLTIHKYPLEIDDLQCVLMPRGARILAVQNQRDVACIWALVNSSNELEQRMFRMLGTGHPADDVSAACYVGTFQWGPNMQFVFHLFEQPSHLR
jgi:hypothetical protein